MSTELEIPGAGLTTVDKGADPTKPQFRKSQITHDAIIDFILSHPTATFKEIGAAFSYTPQGIAVIVNCDAFRMRYEKRKSQLVDPLVTSRIEDRLNGLAAQSIEILSRKLETSDDGGFALKVMEVSTRANGYGVAKGQQVNANFVVHLPGPAASTAEWSSKFSRPDVEVVRAKEVDAISEAPGNA